MSYTLEACATVDWLLRFGDEGNFGFATTLSANRLEHFVLEPLALCAGLRLSDPPLRAALRAAPRLIHQPFELIEFLLSHAEGEVAAAVAAVQCLVLVHDSCGLLMRQSPSKLVAA